VVDEFLEEGDLADILIEGMRPDAYASYLVSEYEEEKELQRVVKVMISYVQM